MNRILIAVLLCVGQFAWAGHERGGGDEVALIFQQAFETAFENIRSTMPQMSEQLKRLPAIASKARILVVDKSLYVYIMGEKQESAATNSPATQTIFINRDRWNKIQDPHVAEGLALHEIASLAKLEATGNYQFSSQYVRQFGYLADQIYQNEGGPTFKLPAAPPSSIKFTSASGVSTYFVNSGLPEIFGSLAGPSWAGAGAKTIDSCGIPTTCATGSLCTCTRTRIYNQLVTQLNFDTGPSPGNLIAVATRPIARTIPVLHPNNGGRYVDFRWMDLCREMLGTDCENPTLTGQMFSIQVVQDLNNDGVAEANEPSLTISFNLSNPQADTYSVFGQPDAEGIGEFQPWPGDERIYLKDVNTTANFPLLSYGETAATVRVFASTKSMLEATPQGRDVEADLPILADGSGLSQSFISGVKNGQRYFVRLALVDQAGSVVQFFPPMDGLPDSCLKAPSSACPYAVTPQRIMGHVSRK